MISPGPDPAHVAPPQGASETIAGPPSRLVSLDVLRGVAVMGILLLNVAGFALPDGAYYNPAAFGTPSSADVAVWAVEAVVFDGKMRAMFSALFGAGLLLIHERALAAGHVVAAAHYSRMAWLFLFGCAHFLLWRGDILAHYALLGSLGWLLRDKPIASLLAGALCLTAAQASISADNLYGLYQLRAVALTPDAAPAAVRAWLDLRGQIGLLDPSSTASALALYRGGLGGIVHDHLARLDDIRRQAVFGGAETLALMLLGMAGLKSGFLAGRWSRHDYVRLAAWLYGIALPVQIGLVIFSAASGFDSLTTFGISTLGGTLLRPALAAAHAALLLAWLAAPTGRVGRVLLGRVAAVGRAAFTNYLGTTLMMTAIFQGWGLGLFGRLGRADLLLVVLATWAVMLAWSPAWLRRYHFGPFEWLWRSLARGRMQPMRRSKHSIAT